MSRTTLSRRIRRIALLPSVKNENGTTDRPHIDYTPEQLAAQITTLTANLRAERATRRKKAGK